MTEWYLWQGYSEADTVEEQAYKKRVGLSIIAGRSDVD